jgi:hypothetical protein
MTELYTFDVDGTIYNFTPSVFSKTVGSTVFSPTLLIRDKLSVNDNLAQSTLTIKFSDKHFLAKQLLLQISETISQIIIGDENNVPFYHGEITGAEAKPPYIYIYCDSAYSRTKKRGVTQKATLLCRHILYDGECTAVQVLFARNYSTLDTSSSIITVTGIVEASGYFNGGIVTMGGQTRRIIKQNSTTITVNYPFNTNMSGTIVLYPGCNLTVNDCKNKFNNLANGGMFPAMPLTNPMTSSSGAI